MLHTTGTNPEIPILFEDNHLLIVCKPVNLLSQADHTGDTDLLTLCKLYLKKKHQKPGKVYLGLVHRLDRPVGGVMALAKTSKAASRLSEQIRERTFYKRYLLVAEGKTPINGVFVHYLLKDQNTNHVTSVSPRERKAKKAELGYQRIDYNEELNLSLVKVNLITGRPHQIRVQFATEGYPLLGDRKYGTDKSAPESPALYASEICFRHPVLGEMKTYSTLPPDIKPWKYFNMYK